MWWMRETGAIFITDTEIKEPMKKDAAYYTSRGFDAATAQYFASGRRKVVSAAANPDYTEKLQSRH